jgi:hypothetical protein
MKRPAAGPGNATEGAAPGANGHSGLRGPDTIGFRLSGGTNPFFQNAFNRPGSGTQGAVAQGAAAEGQVSGPGGSLSGQFGLAVAYADPAGLSEAARRFHIASPEAAADLPRVAATLTGARHASLWPGPQSPPPAPVWPEFSDETAQAPSADLPAQEAFTSVASSTSVAPMAAVLAPQVLELGSETLGVLRGIETQLAQLTRLVEAQNGGRATGGAADEPPEPFGEITHGDAIRPMTWPPLGESIEDDERAVVPDTVPVRGPRQAPEPQNGPEPTAQPGAWPTTRSGEPEHVVFAGDRGITASSEHLKHKEFAREDPKQIIPVAAQPAVRNASDLPERALFPAGSTDPRSLAEEAERVARIHRASLAARRAADDVAAGMASTPMPAQALSAPPAPASSNAFASIASTTAAPDATVSRQDASIQRRISAFLAFALPRWLALVGVIIAAGVVLHLLTGGGFDTLPAGLVSADWWASLFGRIYRTLERIDRFMLDLFQPLQRAVTG